MVEYSPICNKMRKISSVKLIFQEVKYIDTWGGVLKCPLRILGDRIWKLFGWFNVFMCFYENIYKSKCQLLCLPMNFSIVILSHETQDVRTRCTHHFISSVSRCFPMVSLCQKSPHSLPPCSGASLLYFPLKHHHSVKLNMYSSLCLLSVFPLRMWVSWYQELFKKIYLCILSS